jgi:hypothetical protein
MQRSFATQWELEELTATDACMQFATSGNQGGDGSQPFEMEIEQLHLCSLVRMSHFLLQFTQKKWKR